MIRVVHPGSGFRIRILIYYPSRIPDTGVNKARIPDPDPLHSKYLSLISYAQSFTYACPSQASMQLCTCRPSLAAGSMHICTCGPLLAAGNLEAVHLVIFYLARNDEAG
jgi:hypothetical protein